MLLNLSHDLDRTFPGVGEFHSTCVGHEIAQPALPVLLELSAATLHVLDLDRGQVKAMRSELGRQ
jgi:hypothetical protein